MQNASNTSNAEQQHNDVNATSLRFGLGRVDRGGVGNSPKVTARDVQ